MKVQQILQSKGVEVFAVTGETSIAEAVKTLGEKNIGAVIVKDSQGVVTGILSERDIVRKLNSQGPDVLHAKVSSCMTPDPFCCNSESTVDELMTKMTEKRIRHMPVVDDGKLVGMVSIGDVVKRKINEAEQEAAALKEYISS